MDLTFESLVLANCLAVAGIIAMVTHCQSS